MNFYRKWTPLLIAFGVAVTLVTILEFVALRRVDTRLLVKVASMWAVLGLGWRSRNRPSSEGAATIDSTPCDLPATGPLPLIRRPLVRWQGYALTLAAGEFILLYWWLLAVMEFSALGFDVTSVKRQEFWSGWHGFAGIWPLAGLEEIFFRAPLAIAAVLGPTWLVPLLATLLSALFGLGHGASLQHLVIQGGEGLILSFIFLRCGGLFGEPFKGWACSTMAHGVFNSVIGLLAIAAGPS